ncbi:ATPase WRNIP1 [Marmota marmota marmota]|uniref:ATPase WRNIP1 n=1 Tax=Marmota marmota marmota TaxID=9994 RepID=UPI0007627A1A|nr:ATPase WRNIP1 [Marmota marmota marmota]
MEVSGPEDDPFLSQLHQVQCPVCQQMMPAAHINSHLDRCLLLHPAGHAEPAAGPHRAGERAKGPSPPGAKRRRLSESSALKQPATPTAAESSEGEGEEGDDGGETESRESYDAPPTPSGARLIPDFPVARSSSPARKGAGKRPAAAAAAAGSGSPRSWDEEGRAGGGGRGEYCLDTFLPHVECGTITLIGATTENPSFQVNAALLSRCRVIVLEKLPVEAMVTILMRAINSLGIHVLDSSRPTDPLSHSSNSSSEPSVFIEDKAVDTLAYLSDGDARAGLNGLQLAVLARLSSRKMFCKKSGQTYSPSRVLITENDVKEGLQRSHILYDRAGEEHYNCISALHKAMRGSDQNASLYWLARMLEGGEDPLYVARRLVRFASEDIGLADPSALTQAVAAYQGCHFIGMPECEVLLAQCVVYFARAPKSIEVYSAYNNVKACLRNHQGPLPPVPLHLRNAPTRLMKDLGYGKGYKYNPMYSEPVDQEYLPEELRGVDFFKQRRC